MYMWTATEPFFDGNTDKDTGELVCAQKYLCTHFSISSWPSFTSALFSDYSRGRACVKSDQEKINMDDPASYQERDRASHGERDARELEGHGLRATVIGACLVVLRSIWHISTSCIPRHSDCVVTSTVRLHRSQVCHPRLPASIRSSPVQTTSQTSTTCLIARKGSQ